MQTQPIEYIQSKGWEHKKQSGQIVLKKCPFCDDEKWHFYIDPNDKGPWYCHKCQEKGNLWRLMKSMGDIQETIQSAFKKPEYKKPTQDKAGNYHQTLLKNSEAVEYILGRGIKRESIDKFKLGFYQNNGKKWLTIPHYQGKNLVNIKFRSLPPAEKTFRFAIRNSLKSLCTKCGSWVKYPHDPKILRVTCWLCVAKEVLAHENKKPEAPGTETKESKTNGKRTSIPKRKNVGRRNPRA